MDWVPHLSSGGVFSWRKARCLLKKISMKITKLIRVEGKVQGVGYRESMKEEARRLGVTGWVRNRRDGSVEALVQGEAPLVQDLLTWCRRGPSRAAVDHVQESEAPPDQALADFIRRETE
jgi:acylphosphatase